MDESLNACRTLTTEICPPILHDRGLIPALEWLSTWFDKHHGLKVNLVLPVEEPPFDDSGRVTLFEVVRELLFNVVKHAGVREASVSLCVTGGKAELVVEDHGAGCDLKHIEDESGNSHFGLFSIRERLRIMEGDFSFESTPGQGARLAVFLPLPTAATIANTGEPLKVASCTVGDAVNQAKQSPRTRFERPLTAG